MKKKTSKKGKSKTMPRHGVVMAELPTDEYFDSSVASVKRLTKQGFDGVYLSFNRPYRNVVAMLRTKGVDTRRLLFIDGATKVAGERSTSEKGCIFLSEGLDVDEIVRAIYSLLDRLAGKRRFIFIDSLAMIAVHKPLSETMRLAEFLMREVKKDDGILLVFNVPRDLAQKKFIRDIALRADTVISAP